MDYNSLKNMAYNQIVDKGLAMSIIRPTRSSYNVSTGSYTTVETSYSCYGVRLNFKKEPHKSGTVVEESLEGMQNIQVENILFLIPASGLEIIPQRTDKISFNSIVYEIEAVENISPNGLDILYKIIARK